LDADLLQYIFGGLTSGAIYALIALGFCVVSNTMGIVNFIQVDFVTLGGMFMFSALFALGLPVTPALGLAVILVAVTAMIVERLGLRPARTQNHMILVFLTVGLSIILRGVIKMAWGTNRMAVPPLTPDVPVQILGASVLPQALWILGLTVVAIAVLTWFFHRTSLGLSMRAVASNPTAAAVVGIPAGRVRLTSYAIAGALGGLAGVLVTPITTLNYDVGVLLGLKGFAAAILGGFGSFPGAIIGGLGLGLLETLSAGYLSSAYKDVVAFVVLLLVLCVRPKGLLGK
jgi:branched-chain amino acid transport system permease protein